MNEIATFLKTIVETMGVSGNEKAITRLFETAIHPYMDSVEYDNFGNLIAHKKGKGRKVMLIAHADEVGFIVKHIDEHGFVYIQEIGGIDTNLLPGREIVFTGINGEKVIGIIGKRPIHLQEKDKPKDWECEELWVDIGAGSQKKALGRVDIGCYGSYAPKFEMLGKHLVKSKALDDRCGIAVLLGVAKQLFQEELNCDLFLICSVQEELGARGAHTAADKIKPDVAIAIDVTHATDYPSMSVVKNGNIRLGEGAVVAYGPNIDVTVTDMLINAANDSNTKIQKEVLSRPTGTDINPIQIYGTGVKTALLSIPCRYMHTPVEIVSLKDIKSAITILTKYLTI